MTKHKAEAARILRLSLEPDDIPAEEHFSRWREVLQPRGACRPLIEPDWRLLGPFDVYRLPNIEVAFANVSPFEYVRASPPQYTKPKIAISFCLEGELVFHYNKNHVVRTDRQHFIMANANMDARVIAEVPVRYVTIYLSGSSMLSASLLTDTMPAAQIALDEKLHPLLTMMLDNFRHILAGDDLMSAMAMVRAFEAMADQLSRPIQRDSHTVNHDRVAAIQAFIDANLRDPDLSVDTLCDYFHMSRATLYRQMQPLGGVKYYLQLRRLSCCLDELRKSMPCDDSYKRSLVKSYMFRSLRDFYQRYQQIFGVDPETLIVAAADLDQVIGQDVPPDIFSLNGLDREASNG